jgi:HPt (histidine-containing phosphotransfer) domain-containing protein
MSGPSDEFFHFLEEQRLDYHRALPAKLVELETAWDSMAADSGDAAWTVLERMAHNLAGSAGTFGFTEIGDAAKLLERAIQARVEDGIASAIAELRRNVRGNG